MNYPLSQAILHLEYMSAVEVNELNDILAARLASHLYGKARAKVLAAARVADLAGYCGDCASVQEDEPRGLCAVHAGKCVNCAAADDLHDGELSRTKVDAAGNPVVEKYCNDCDPPTMRTGQP